MSVPPTGDLDPEEFRRLAHEAVEWMADYLRDVGDLAVLPDVRPGDVRRALPAHPPEEGEPLDRTLADFRDVVVPATTHWNHPRFFGYFSITGSGPGILGEMLTAALNVNHMLWRSGPGPTELEEVTTDWIRQLVGLPPEFEGVINDTASTSTMYALAAARELAWPGARSEGLFGQRPGRVYASAQTHSSVEKSVVALGMGRDGFRAIPTDGEFRMRPDALRAALEQDAATGIRPVAVVPTLGTTSTTAVDPVAEIARIAREYGAWVHVDAAYGGPAALLPEVRARFHGWEDADSIVINPHKWLFTPVDCSILYCRRPEVLVRAFSLVPAYLETPEDGQVRNLMDYGVALGRRFRSLKLWFVLRTFGAEGLRSRIRASIDLAARLEAWIEAEPGWTMAAPALLGLAVFRYAPDGIDDAEADRLNQDIIERVNATGRVFVGPTRLGHRTVIRLSVGNLKTTEDDVAEAWTLLRRAAGRVSPDPTPPVSAG